MQPLKMINPIWTGLCQPKRTRGGGGGGGGQNGPFLRLQLHGAIYCPDSFVLMLRYYANLKAIRYESTSLNRIVADKSHRVIVA